MGVSNYEVRHIEEIKDYGKEMPVANQVSDQIEFIYFLLVFDNILKVMVNFKGWIPSPFHSTGAKGLLQAGRNILPGKAISNTILAN